MLKHLLTPLLIIITATFGTANAETREERNLRVIRENHQAILIKTTQGLGVEFEFNNYKCENNKGMLGYWSPNERKIVICSKNHVNDAEVRNTIRHEVIHVAQQCKAKHKGAVALVPQTVFASDIPAHLYPVEQHQTEAEARWFANNYGDLKIAEILVRQCVLNIND